MPNTARIYIKFFGVSICSKDSENLDDFSLRVLNFSFSFRNPYAGFVDDAKKKERLVGYDGKQFTGGRITPVTLMCNYSPHAPQIVRGTYVGNSIKRAELVYGHNTEDQKFEEDWKMTFYSAHFDSAKVGAMRVQDNTKYPDPKNPKKNKPFGRENFMDQVLGLTITLTSLRFNEFVPCRFGDGSSKNFEYEYDTQDMKETIDSTWKK